MYTQKFEKCIDATIQKPETYELCKLYLDAEKFVVGWWTGCGWCGKNVKDEMDIKYWKYHRPVYSCSKS